MKTMICIENVSYSQFNYEAITQANNVCEKSLEEICFVSLDQTMPFIDIRTAVYAPYDMDSFHNGIMIAHTLNAANIILGCANNCKKVLYLYDIDWMFQPIFYDEVYRILNSKNLFLIARSQDHADIIKKTSDREVDAILSNFNLEDIWNLL